MIEWTVITRPLDADGSLVSGIGQVSGVGDEYHLYSKSTQVPGAAQPQWTHEFFVLIFPPSPVFGRHPKRSQSFPSNEAMLTAVGHDIDRDLAAQS